MASIARRPLRILAYVGVWFAAAFVITTALFFTGSRQVEVASHDAVVRPNLSGEAVLLTGPVLPDVRIAGTGVLGVGIRLDKTDATSTDELVRRYAYIASQPEGQVARVTGALEDMLLDAALRGAVLGLVPLAVWVLVGRQRRRDLAARTHLPQVLVAVGVTVVLGACLVQPWTDDAPPDDELDWVSIEDFLGPQVPVPEGLEDVEVRGDVTTAQTRRLIDSAIDTYEKSKVFYAQAAEGAATLDLRQPREGDTVVAFVSDRHDNIGMDPVARAIADRAGATAVYDGGDDTSNGKSWEAFSLDSVSEAFDGLDRWAVAGNHDHGAFVHEYLADHGWTMLDGEVVDGPGDTTLLGVDDPRSSGLGSWRDETGLSFDEVEQRLADEACATEERLTTMLVHDANLGREALARGCVDLVLGGHLHVRSGPTRVDGDNGEIGYTYTTGTTGGAAYAIAIGSKPRRNAEVSLVTYREGRPAGIQWVTLQPNGVFQIGTYVPLRYPEPVETEDEFQEEPEGEATTP
ncbi:metallophosphoesterase [Nocardioides sp. YIM 152315]|uniref:metallophosphoesterase family protein n=1 Tax=Nocardioides sp. YIM 152315 TaxID=3031760 RepID=UPI0023DB2FC4|nr:metallophosphoesterase [Nocardioides sp. YIM 152315]MDF1604925.1 metallophosphoesterase [Nocardioides sp. YIM 152315]